MQKLWKVNFTYWDTIFSRIQSFCRKIIILDLAKIVTKCDLLTINEDFKVKGPLLEKGSLYLYFSNQDPLHPLPITLTGQYGA